MGNGCVAFFVGIIVFDVFADEISELNGVTGEEVHDVETGGHNFGDGGDIVLGVVVDGEFPQFVAVGKVAVITSEENLFVIGDSDRGAWEHMLSNGFVDEIVQRRPVQGNTQGQEKDE